MNWIARRQKIAKKAALTLAGGLLLSACGTDEAPEAMTDTVAASPSAAQHPEDTPVSAAPAIGDHVYSITYTVTLNPDEGSAQVELALVQPQHLLRELSFDLSDSVAATDADGDWEREDGRVVWQPPVAGGSLHWTVKLAHRRNDKGYDALLSNEWGLFRGEDLIPRARTRTLRGAESQTRLIFATPDDWSVVTPYPSEAGAFQINHPNRRFDEPRGWMLAGELGVRRETVAGVQLAVAAPQGNDVRRLDTLALLNWGIPEIANFVPNMPERITVISAGDPMWRGGLSAPQSLYIHADRPLISENGSSTLLHEVMHIVLGIRGETGYDWIVEGIAEFYSIEVLRRSGAITERRFERAMQRQHEWAETADSLCQPHSKGATTALAVTVFAALDQEIRDATENAASLDTVAAELATTPEPINLDLLLRIVESITPEKTEALNIENLPGCPYI